MGSEPTNLIRDENIQATATTCIHKYTEKQITLRLWLSIMVYLTIGQKPVRLFGKMRSTSYHETSKTQPQFEWKCDVLCVLFVCVCQWCASVCVQWWCDVVVLSIFLSLSFLSVSASDQKYVKTSHNTCAYKVTLYVNELRTHTKNRIVIWKISTTTKFEFESTKKKVRNSSNSFPSEWYLPHDLSHASLPTACTHKDVCAAISSFFFFFEYMTRPLLKKRSCCCPAVSTLHPSMPLSPIPPELLLQPHNQQVFFLFRHGYSFGACGHVRFTTLWRGPSPACSRFSVHLFFSFLSSPSLWLSHCLVFEICHLVSHGQPTKEVDPNFVCVPDAQHVEGDSKSAVHADLSVSFRTRWF